MELADGVGVEQKEIWLCSPVCGLDWLARSEESKLDPKKGQSALIPSQKEDELGRNCAFLSLHSFLDYLLG